MSLYLFTIFLVLSVFISWSLTNGENSEDSEVNNSIRITKDSSEFDEILNWEPPYDLKKNLPYFLSGYDSDGCSVWIVEFGKWDVRGQIEAYGFQPVQKYIRQMLVTAYTFTEREQVQEFSGNNQTTTPTKVGAGEQNERCENLEYSVIVDMDGFTNRQMTHPPTITTCLNLARVLFSLEGQGQRLKKLFGINFNYLADALYSLAAPLLGSVTNRITILGTNQDRWKPKVLKAFPKSALPDWMGGSQDFKPVRIYG